MWKITFIFIITLYLQISPNAGARKGACGGTYMAARGILSTPNFPGPFDVPIKCQWIIDASNVVSANTSIVVYLTQLFSYEGLTFTEYQLYGSDYKINPKVIHKVNETNVIRTRWVQTYQSYLVIELKMQSAESAHLRVLDKFLDTYGFNITYEITTSGVRGPSCTMMDCGFTGICYDHYTKFACRCFDGYSGANCSEGPKSFCYTNGTPTCKNGGTCLHVGVAAVKCHCPKVFTGNTCETSVEQVNFKALNDCPNCPTNCTYEGKMGNGCNCLNSKTDPGQSGIFATLHLGNLPALGPNELKAYIKTQILRHLQTNVSKVEDLSIVSLVHYMSGADVTFKVSAPKKEEKKVKNIMNKWADRGYVANITVAEKDSSMKTPLSLQSVDINQPGVIRENDEFILSCVARGSPSMTFRWFKDGTFVNLTYARHKWIKLIKDPHVTDQYTALLAVERAQKQDEGKFTCQVEDFNIQQCMAKYVKIKRRPLVKIEPMSLTVRKGQNFTIKCVTLEGNGGIGGKYTYSWTKNKELLPVRTESEKYETLYPAGTILQIFRAERDIRYSCLVQDSATSTEKNIQIYVLDRKGVNTCSKEYAYNLSWPETAPDTDYFQDCPKGYTGIVTRRCILTDVKKPTWGIVDFSECTNNMLKEVYSKFEGIKLGYVTSNIADIFSEFLTYVSSVQLRPGEGAKILQLMEEMLLFLGQTKIGNFPVKNITLTIFSVADRILLASESLMGARQINLFQKILFDQLKISANVLTEQETLKSFNLSLNTLDITGLKETSAQATLLYVPTTSGRKFGEKSWVAVKLTAQRMDSKTTGLYAGIIYRNLLEFYPPQLFLRLRDGSEIQYQIFSQIMTFAPVFQNDTQNDEKISVSIDFQHKFSTDLVNASNGEKWEIRCGYSERRSFGYTWDIQTCNHKYVDDRATNCNCSKFGAYVLILVLTQPEEEVIPDEPQKYILLCSLFLCIILTMFTTISLVLSCIITRSSPILILKLQCSISVVLCQLLFTLAILSEPPQHYFMVFLTFLEMFLLLGLSSHLSKLLIIFTELINVPKSVSSKYTVMGIISGVPLITMFGNHLAYKTMDMTLKSWWMLKNSLALNTLMFVVTIITGLFIFVYISVTRKLRELIVSQEKHEKAVRARISIIKRSACIFVVLLTFMISSIIYINNQNEIWSIYQFAVVNILLGLVLLTFYVFKSEVSFRKMFQKESFKKEENCFCIDSTGPFNFLTKEDANLDNQPGQRRIELHQISQKCLETNKVTASRTQSISNAFESCLQSSSNFCDVSVKETSTRGKDKNQTNLETYCSPVATGNRNISTTNGLSYSPDILTTKSCVGLDLVASSMCISKSEVSSNVSTIPSALKSDKKPSEHKTVRITFPPEVIITPEESISKILETETSAVQIERTQPDGHAEILSGNESKTSSSQHVTFKEDNLDGVLDSISHDLDYLLNRSDKAECVMGVSTLTRKMSKPLGAAVVNQVPEELITTGESGSVPEGIMLRTNC